MVLNARYQVCARCVMDTSDPEIRFDGDGVCNHCIEFESVTRQHWFPNDEGRRRWAAIAERIRTEGRGREYDCILGLTGGVDSSYLALKVHDWGCARSSCTWTPAGTANWRWRISRRSSSTAASISRPR